MNRDGWCTPRKITKRLPVVDLDPCSNPRSTVRAKQTCMLERGQNGLLVSWEGKSVFVNPPWSKPKKFAIKAHTAASWCFLVLEDSSTEWWGILTQFPCYRFSFNGRVGFKPPPGVGASTNDRPCTLVCDIAFRLRIGDAFANLGRWWKSE